MHVGAGGTVLRYAAHTLPIASCLGRGKDLQRFPRVFARSSDIEASHVFEADAVYCSTSSQQG